MNNENKRKTLKKSQIYQRWYWSDYFANTVNMSAEEELAYFRIIGHYWLHQGALDDDDVKLAHIAKVSVRKFKTIRTRVLSSFKIFEGKLFHPRLEEELGNEIDIRKSCQNSANSRWNKETGDTIAQKNDLPTQNDRMEKKHAIAEQSHMPPIPSPIPKEDTLLVSNETRSGAAVALPQVVDLEKQGWDVGYALLAGYGFEKKPAGKLLGKWRSQAGSAKRFLEILNEAGKEVRGDIVAYIGGILKDRGADILVDWLYGLQGGWMKRTTAEFHVDRWKAALGIEAVTQAITKAKDTGWKRDKTIEHLDELAAGKTRDNYQKPKETAALNPPVEDPHWVAVRDQMIANVPGARSWLGETVRSVYVNDQIVKIRAASRTCLEHIQGYSPRMLELFQIQKPGIEKIEVAM